MTLWKSVTKAGYNLYILCNVDTASSIQLKTARHTKMERCKVGRKIY